jgi:hypothetical protein
MALKEPAGDEDGRHWPSINTGCTVILSFRLLVAGYWSLVTGRWLLVVGCWLLVSGPLSM